MHNRRQFGLWMSLAVAQAALPTMAVASPPPNPVVQQAAPSPFDGVTFRTEHAWLESGALAVTVYAKNGGEARSISFTDAVVELSGGALAAEQQLLSWLNGEHPLSRRMRMPSAVDLPHGREVVASTVHVQVPAELRAQAGAALSIGVRAAAGVGESHVIPLGVVAVGPEPRSGT
jgi:hypothetical protein